jgi:HK97 gp10 family phage protein
MDTTSISLDTRELDRLIHDFGMDARDIVEGLAFECEGHAKTLAPVDTGAMMNSIDTKVYPQGNVVAEVGPHVEYAIYVELGTYKMRARPFLSTAAEMVAIKLNRGDTWHALFAKGGT